MMRTASLMAAFVTAALGLAGGRLAVAQDRASVRAEPRPTKNPFEGDRQAISNGGAMFRTRCAGCHGADARGYLGPDLTGFWSAGGTDDRMFDIVRRGVPGTEMPAADPTRVLDKDIWHTLAYVRTLSAVPAATLTGDAGNGERIFTARMCSSVISAPRRHEAPSSTAGDRRGRDR
jgi:mono/diheme cytochrome c family protein